MSLWVLQHGNSSLLILLGGSSAQVWCLNCTKSDETYFVIINMFAFLMSLSKEQNHHNVQSARLCLDRPAKKLTIRQGIPHYRGSAGTLTTSGGIG
jgi:hypothetical protein